LEKRLFSYILLSIYLREISFWGAPGLETGSDVEAGRKFLPLPRNETQSSSPQPVSLVTEMPPAIVKFL
jgi:hypothetical protein